VTDWCEHRHELQVVQNAGNVFTRRKATNFQKKDFTPRNLLIWYLTQRNLSGLHQSIFAAEARQNITLDVMMQCWPGLLDTGLQTVSVALSAYITAIHNSQGLRHSFLSLYNLRGSESVVTQSSNLINSDTRRQYKCLKRNRFSRT
jgi:hypothetical protein